MCVPLLVVLSLLLSASVASSQSIEAGAALYLNWCDGSDPLQAFVVNANTVTSLDGTLCVTMSSPYPSALTMETCIPNYGLQQWSYGGSNIADAFVSTNASAGNCLDWNTQGGPGYETQGSIVGVYSCTNPASFDSVFTVGFPSPSLIAANFTSPGNSTFSDLCVAAKNPAPPPIGTPSQIAWAETEFACFIHWNMATAAGTQGCNCNQPPPPISIWAPTALDTDAWIEAGMTMGCKRFVYVAKHGCGFCTWPSKATILGQEYPYSVKYAPNTTDVVGSFVASAKSHGVGFGFYYSVVSNALLNLCSGNVGGSPSPGQLNVTQAQAEAFILEQLTEIWSAYGPLEEVWFDGAYPASMTKSLQQLFATLQPNVVAFGAAGVCNSPARWIGTEDGYAPYPTWSTVLSEEDNGAGDPAGAFWVPPETDFTLQSGDQWFYNPAAGVRSFNELRNMYETSIGHNSAIIVDFAPAPNGSIPADQLANSAALGAYVSQCYQNPIATTAANGTMILTVTTPSATSVDRIRIWENLALGELVRSFTLTATLANGTVVSVFQQGQSIGNSFIYVLSSPLADVMSVTLNITSVAKLAPPGAPYIKNFAIFACDALADEISEGLEAKGFPQRTTAETDSTRKQQHRDGRFRVF